MSDALRVLEQINLRPGSAHPCPYLPGRQARDAAFQVRRLPSGLYRSLMDLNFRRSGLIVYRPACEECNQCQAIRVAPDRFKPNRSQRRCWAANADLTIGLTPTMPSREKHELYARYLRQRHTRQMEESWDAFCDFLYRSPVDSVEVTYRRSGRLMGVGLLDFDGNAVSTVYCYYEPDERCSLGTFNILWTLDYCRRLGIPWVYLGYAIRDCPKMNYKLHFRPHEVLDSDGNWAARDLTM
jgi:leucyl-tRNA---protein transferase